MMWRKSVCARCKNYSKGLNSTQWLCSETPGGHARVMSWGHNEDVPHWCPVRIWETSGLTLVVVCDSYRTGYDVCREVCIDPRNPSVIIATNSNQIRGLRNCIVWYQRGWQENEIITSGNMWLLDRCQEALGYYPKEDIKMWKCIVDWTKAGLLWLLIGVVIVGVFVIGALSFFSNLGFRWGW